MNKKLSLFRRSMLFVLTVVLIFGTILFIFNYDKYGADGLRRWIAYREIFLSDTGESDPFAHAGGGFASFALMDNAIVMASTSGSRYYSLTGAIYAETVATFQNPVLRQGNRSCVAFDAGSQVLTLYRDGDGYTPFDNGQNILSARLNQNDWLVVVAQEKGYKSSATVFNASLETKLTIRLSSAFIVDAMVSSDNSKVALVTISESQGSFQTSVHVYKMGETEPVSVTPLTHALVIDMNYQDDTLWVLCEDRLVIHNTARNTTNEWLFGTQYLKNANLEGDGYATLLFGKYRAGLANSVVVIDKDGETVAQKEITQEVLSIHCAGRYIGILSSNSLEIFTNELELYAMLEDIAFATDIAITSNGSLVLASNQEVWMYLPN